MLADETMVSYGMREEEFCKQMKMVKEQFELKTVTQICAPTRRQRPKCPTVSLALLQPSLDL